MDCTRAQFLARAALTGDQNCGPAGRHLLDQRENLPHLARRSHHLPEHAASAQLPLQALRMFGEAALFQRA